MKIPEDMTDEEVLFLSDILPTGYQAAEMGEIKAGETVVVFGCGPVGLFAQKCAWVLGAGQVIGVDLVEARLKKARDFAQSEVVDFNKLEDIVLHVREMTGGRGPDVCIDAVGMEAEGSKGRRALGLGMKLEAGAANVIGYCINTVRKGGNVSIIGVYADHHPPVFAR